MNEIRFCKKDGTKLTPYSQASGAVIHTTWLCTTCLVRTKSISPNPRFDPFTKTPILNDEQ